MDGWREVNWLRGAREEDVCFKVRKELLCAAAPPLLFLLSVMLLYLTVALPRVKAEISASIVTCSSNHFPPFMPQWRRAITITR